MKPWILASCLLLGSGLADAAPAHPCVADAIEHAKKLLRFHYDVDATQPISVDETVKVLPTVAPLKGPGRFDVLEVWGSIYKANYRMHFIYSQTRGNCLLMGQEIFEASNPY